MLLLQLRWYMVKVTKAFRVNEKHIEELNVDMMTI